jgi:hypothetical protein
VDPSRKKNDDIPLLNWELNREQEARFADYLRASTLLLDCLKLAYVSDRAAIENRLLLPPATA